jgi:hypothetical protein
MSKIVNSSSAHALLLAGAALALGACAPEVVGLEVLPARTSATCSAPNLQSSASGRGLLDLDATRILHGAYESDIRITAAGGDVRVDGLALSYSLPDDVADATAAADAVTGLHTVGDLFLNVEDDEPVAGIIEDVVLLPRTLSVALREDSGLEADQVVFATVDVTIEATADGVPLGAPASFPIDVCRGCLVTEPDEDDCAAGFEDAGACRPGQDVPLFVCSAAAAPPVGFP